MVGGWWWVVVEGELSVHLWSKTEVCSFDLDLDQAEQQVYCSALVQTETKILVHLFVCPCIHLCVCRHQNFSVFICMSM